jgi:hypothetical protein
MHILLEINHLIRFFGLALSLFTLISCSSLVSSVTNGMASSLTSAMLNHNDIDTVKTALPAYLLMIDGFVRDDPENIDLLLTRAKLYGAYVGAFVKEKPRIKRLSQTAFDSATQAACLHRDDSCTLRNQPFDEFKQVLAKLTKDDVAVFYVLGTSWASWLQANSNDWNAIAELPRITAIMQRLIELDEEYQYGGAHLYLGIIETLIPPALGGKPDIAQAHFKRAIELSQGKNLYVKVVYAQRYARLLFDRELHDQLLNEVLKADPVTEDFTLMNLMAQTQAKQLLDSADDYF